MAHPWVDIEDGESMDSVRAKLNELGEAFEAVEATANAGGHARYHTTTGTVASGVDTWTQLTNNGLGVRTDTDHLPLDATSLLDTATGMLDVSELTEGDTVLVQLEYGITITAGGGVYCELRFQTDEPSGIIDHVVQLGDLNKGTGTYSFSTLHLLDMSGHDRDTLIPVEVRCTANSTLIPSAMILKVSRKEATA